MSYRVKDALVTAFAIVVYGPLLVAFFAWLAAEEIAWRIEKWWRGW